MCCPPLDISNAECTCMSGRPLFLFPYSCSVEYDIAVFDPALIGLALTYTISVTSVFQFVVRQSTEVENIVSCRCAVIQWNPSLIKSMKCTVNPSKFTLNYLQLTQIIFLSQSSNEH